ncbi:MAG: hypothetical protein EPN94_03055 [Nitrospirae bacterium]|nr:MAG: hypothetical protein EPN94_03055 [Nitrospirota bacterium]
MPLMKVVAMYLIIAMFIIGITPKAEAGLVQSEMIAIAQTDRAADLGKIQKAIEIKMVGERLEKFGLTQDEIQARLGSLNDQQIHKLALQVDDIKAGGDGLGIVITLLVIAILVVLLLQLTGKRVVVTK